MTADICVGTLVDSDDGATALLNALKFNRHTFWCGQSGSGKTYALGVVLERLLLGTQLPLLILDPNADFVRIGEVRNDADPESAAALRDLDLRVLRPNAEGPDRLGVRFLDLDLRSKAAVLRLDPVLDAEEYNALLHLDGRITEFGFDRAQLIDWLNNSDNTSYRSLLLRVENVGALDWDVFAWGGQAAEDIIASRPRATVLDLGGFRAADEPKVAALAVLDHLWATREERKPVLIVIDEAHNLCASSPVTLLERALTERIVQIAAEGRKFGLWLLLSTQRPSKIHPNALSQCDNLGLMKMASPRDLAEIGEYFGYAPEALLARSAGFAQGQALLAGGFVPTAAIVQVAQRLTHEGGSDVTVPL